jgi:hypothetical protein
MRWSTALLVGLLACGAEELTGVLEQAGGVRREGDVVEYRLALSGLRRDARHEVTLEWEAIVDGKHAIDELGTPTWADAPHSTFAAPQEAPALLGMWNGMLAGAVRSGTAERPRVTVTFVAAAREATLAWGAHLASHRDHGLGNVLVDLPGASYRMRVVDPVVAERGFAASEIVPHMHVVVEKQVVNDDGTGSAVPSDFTLVMEGPARPESFRGSTAGTFVEVEGPRARPWWVSESGPAGYTASNECAGKILDEPQSALVRCRIVNDDDSRCVHVICPPPRSECELPGVCDPVTIECVYWKRPAGFPCEGDGVCDGAGLCTH